MLERDFDLRPAVSLHALASEAKGSTWKKILPSFASELAFLQRKPKTVDLA